MTLLVTNRNPGSDYFRALVEFERDLPSRLPPAKTPESAVEALGDLHRVFLELDAGAARPPTFESPSVGGRAREFTLSQLEPLEAV